MTVNHYIQSSQGVMWKGLSVHARASAKTPSSFQQAAVGDHISFLVFMYANSQLGLAWLVSSISVFRDLIPVTIYGIIYRTCLNCCH